MQEFQKTVTNSVNSFIEKFNSLKYAPQIKTMLLIFALIFLASIIISIELALFAHRMKIFMKESEEKNKELSSEEFEKFYSEKYPIKSTIFSIFILPAILLLIPILITSIILVLPIILLHVLIYSKTQHTLFDAELIKEIFSELPNEDENKILESKTLEEKIKILIKVKKHILSKLQSGELQQSDKFIFNASLNSLNACFNEKNIDFLYKKLSSNLEETNLQDKINFIFTKIREENENIEIIDEKDIGNFVKKHIGDKRKIKDSCLKILFFMLLIPFLIPLIIFLLLISPIIITLFLNAKSILNEEQKETQDKLIESYLFLGFSTFEETQDKNIADKIKKNYKKLSLIFHPDKNKNGTELIQKINQARDFLTNQDKSISFTEKQFNIIKKQFDQKYQNQDDKKLNIFESVSKNKKIQQENQFIKSCKKIFSKEFFNSLLKLVSFGKKTNEDVRNSPVIPNNAKISNDLTNDQFRLLTKLFKDQKTQMRIENGMLFTNKKFSDDEKKLFIENFGIIEIELSNCFKVGNDDKINLLKFLKEKSSDEGKNNLEGVEINTEEVNWNKNINIDNYLQQRDLPNLI